MNSVRFAGMDFASSSDRPSSSKMKRLPCLCRLADVLPPGKLFGPPGGGCDVLKSTERTLLDTICRQSQLRRGRGHRACCAPSPVASLSARRSGFFRRANHVSRMPARYQHFGGFMGRLIRRVDRNVFLTFFRHPCPLTTGEACRPSFFHCHGGMPGNPLALEHLLLKCGAHAWRSPGNSRKRAFLNGKLDLQPGRSGWTSSRASEPTGSPWPPTSMLRRFFPRTQY